MMYLEFINKDRFMPVEVFFSLGGQSAWRDPNDELLGQISRLGGTGPLPGHIAFCRFNSFKRLDEWEDHFRSDSHRTDKRMHAKHKAIEHWRAGCYDELVPASRHLNSPRYYLEFLAHSKELNDQHFKARLAEKGQRAGATLEFALRRIGKLGPDPSDLVVWSMARASDMDELSNSYGLSIVAAGLYRNFAAQ
jgi:hypothetical protein